MSCRVSTGPTEKQRYQHTGGGPRRHAAENYFKNSAPVADLDRIRKWEKSETLSERNTRHNRALTYE